MSLLGPRETATEKHFSIVPLDDLQRLRGTNWQGNITDVDQELYATLLAVFNQLPPETVAIKAEGRKICEDMTDEVSEYNIRILALLGALERVRTQGLTGPGRKRPYTEEQTAQALLNLAKSSDILIYKREREKAKNYLGWHVPEALDLVIERRIDKALDNLAGRVDRKGRGPKKPQDWPTFNDSDQRALVANEALKYALAQGQRGFVSRNLGRGAILATTLAAGLGGAALGGIATSWAFPEQFGAVQTAVNAQVTDGLQPVSPAAAKWYETHYFIPTKTQAAQWVVSNVLPLFADAQKETSEETPEETNP